MSLSEAGIGRTLMQRKLIIAFVVLAVAVLPLTATCVVAADGAQQTAHTCGHRTLPFAGIFSGTYVATGWRRDVHWDGRLHALWMVAGGGASNTRDTNPSTALHDDHLC